MVLIFTQVQHITGTMITCTSYRQRLTNAVPFLGSYLHPEDQFLSQGKTQIANLKARLYIVIFKMVTLYLSIGRYDILAVLYSPAAMSKKKKSSSSPIETPFQQAVFVCDYMLFCFNTQLRLANTHICSFLEVV